MHLFLVLVTQLVHLGLHLLGVAIKLLLDDADLLLDEIDLLFVSLVHLLLVRGHRWTDVLDDMLRLSGDLLGRLFLARLRWLRRHLCLGWSALLKNLLVAMHSLSRRRLLRLLLGLLLLLVLLRFLLLFVFFLLFIINGLTVQDLVNLLVCLVLHLIGFACLLLGVVSCLFLIGLATLRLGVGRLGLGFGILGYLFAKLCQVLCDSFLKESLALNLRQHRQVGIVVEAYSLGGAD